MDMAYGEVRGFNYQPSYAGSLQQAWTAFDRHTWEREVAWSRRFGTNMLRVWLDWHAWIALEDGMFDVLSFHPYTVKPGEMDALCAAHLETAAAYGRPLLCTEACKGSFDNLERGQQARDDVEALQRHGIGWLLWQLVEGRFITGRRDRPDNNALHSMQGYMPFILSDSSTRPGHEWLEVPDCANASPIR